MPPSAITTIGDELSIALGNLTQSITSLNAPVLRLGVTGLSRAGKTIFITSLIENLLKPERLTAFAPVAQGRFLGAQLVEHPDRKTPRFAYEAHLAALRGETPAWPQSTRQISQIRLALRYESQNWLTNWAGPATLYLDIVDYPGEWLLDLPLLSLSYAEWCTEALERARTAHKTPESEAFLEAVANVDEQANADEGLAEHLSGAFKAYLIAARQDKHSLSTLPPGRFLMPGDMEGAPALTFAPLDPQMARAPLFALMQRRYDAYLREVVRPFFRDHFARLDRQIVLVDALRALNTGPEAMNDLETALTSVLEAFRLGANSPWTWFIGRRIDRALFAATKADHVHHTSHDRLEAIVERLLQRAAQRARFAGTLTRSLAIAAVRATKEGMIDEGKQSFPCLIGTPQKGEVLDDTIYAGDEEIALFPGDLPEKPESVFQPQFAAGQLNFLRFNPPKPDPDSKLPLPHIRMDQAIDFLIGDWMK